MKLLSKLVSDIEIGENQKRKINKNLNLNVVNRGIDNIMHNPVHPTTSYAWHRGNGITEKCKFLVISLYPASLKETDRDILVKVTGRNYWTTNGNYEKIPCNLVNTDAKFGKICSETCQCSSHWKRNVGTNTILNEINQKLSHEGKKDYRMLNRDQSDKYDTCYKLIDFPCEIDSIKENYSENKDHIYDRYFVQDDSLNDEFQKLLKSYITQKIGSDYFLQCVQHPELIYCLNQASSRATLEDPYIKAHPDPLPGTMLKDSDRNQDSSSSNEAHEIMDVRDTDEKERKNENVEMVNSPKDTNPSKQRPLANEKDKNKPMIIQDIKYYAGTVNVFDGSGNNDSPYFKVKSLKFDDDKEKPLSIDSWTETDDIIEKQKEPDEKKSNLESQIEEYPEETTTVCVDCLENLAEQKNINMGEEESEKSTTAKMDKSTSTHLPDQNSTDLDMIKDKFVRFIVEVFLEALPKEMYKKMTEPNNRSNNEEIEVRVKSYDTGSIESCDLKSCKMRNPDRGSKVKKFKDEPKNECNCSSPSPPTPINQPEKPSEEPIDSKSPEPPTENNKDTYDCQITLNGRKILLKVDKSVEDLLISGNKPGIVRFSPNDDATPKEDKDINLTDQEEKHRYPSIDESPEESALQFRNMSNEDYSSIREHPRDVNKERRERRRNTIYNNSSTDLSFSPSKVGHTRKKAKSDNPRPSKYPKSVITSSYGTDARKSFKSRTVDINPGFRNSKNIYWSNTEYLGVNKDRILKTKKDIGNDFDPESKVTSQIECPFIPYTNRQNNTDDNAKKQIQSGNLKQADFIYSLLWDPQYLQCCNEILLENCNSDKNTKNLEVNFRKEKLYNFAPEVENRMMASNFNQCNIINNQDPLYIIQCPNEKCRNKQYRDCNVGNATSVDLNSNLFDMGTITCKKCIETLQSCSKLVSYDDSNQTVSYRGNDVYNYYCSRVTGNRVNENVCSEKMENDNIRKSNITRNNECCNAYLKASAPVQGNSQNCCLVNEPVSTKSQYYRCETTEPKVSPRKMYGICFSVNRVIHNVVPNIKENYYNGSSKTKDAGVSTVSMNTKIYQVEMKTSCTQTNNESNEEDGYTTEKKSKSYVCFSFVTTRCKESQKTKNVDLLLEDQKNSVEKYASADFQMMNGSKESQTDTIKSDEQVLVTNESNSRSEDSITTRTIKKKFSLIRILPNWLKKKDTDKETP